MKVQDRQNGPSKSFRAYQKKLAGYAPVLYAKPIELKTVVSKLWLYLLLSSQVVTQWKSII